MKHPLTRELYDYWNGRRGDEAMPERSDIDPAAIRRILADSFVLAAEPGQNARFRVAGTKICELFGRELRGEDFIALWGREAAQQIRDFVALVTGEGIGILAGATTEAGDGLVCPLEPAAVSSRQGRSARARFPGAPRAAVLARHAASAMSRPGRGAIRWRRYLCAPATPERRLAHPRQARRRHGSGER
jgi:hypothetical protein